MKDITILCKVVDNFGDIGFVWRLSKNLKKIIIEKKLDYNIRLVVSDLGIFSKLCPEVNPALDFQIANGFEVFNWNADELCFDAFFKRNPEIIFECFQCGRPAWLERLLFDVGIERTVQILNIEYLTAEDYADTFHCLKSATRSIKVKKVNFMPGFTDRTAGLILDEPYLSHHRFCTALTDAQRRGAPLKVLMFCYERNFAPVIKALDRFEAFMKNSDPSFNMQVFVAQGQGKEAFVNAFSVARHSWDAKMLPFMRQEAWDELICSMDILFIRGEDSMSRACVSGIPFVWNAYVQEDDYQLVKVNALLGRMEKCFDSKSDEDAFKTVSGMWRAYNGDKEYGAGNDALLEEKIFEFLKCCLSSPVKKGFEKFSELVFGNGNFTDNLLEYVEKIVV